MRTVSSNANEEEDPVLSGGLHVRVCARAVAVALIVDSNVSLGDTLPPVEVRQGRAFLPVVFDGCGRVVAAPA